MRDLKLPDIYCDWLYAYLANRTQRVLCNGTKSSVSNITYGVPQGSILGPLLFICFINNLPNVIKYCRVIMYADDVVFYVAHDVLASACELLQDDATSVFNWFTGSGLCINTDKTKVIAFTYDKPSVPHVLSVSMGLSTLETCSQYEYLGVIIDNKLTLEYGINKTVNNSNYRNVMLRKMRTKMSKHTATLVYKQTILPVLDYCGYLYNGVPDYQHKKLQLMQNKCLRICLRVRLKHHVVDLHRDCDVDYLAIRYDLQLLLLIYKYMYGTMHNCENLGLKFQSAVPGGRVMRSTDTGLLEYPASNTMGYRKSPLYRGIELWNMLNTSCRKSETRATFKEKAKVTVVELFKQRQRSKGLLT